jgi:crotonobetainyl-CoA:carnitine CoA-transferase CaiB-like acyl-CoA transferase
MDRPELKKDPRLVTQALRAQHEDIVDKAVEAWTRTMPKAEAANLMRKNRVPGAQVRNLEEVTADPHMHERGMLHDVDHPEMGKVVLPASPLRFHGSPSPSIKLEPAVGENTDDILSEWLDLDETSVTELKVSKAVG